MLLLNGKIFTQIPNKCNSYSAINPPPLNCPIDIGGYYTPTTPLVKVKVNFWITKPSNGQGVFDNITINDANTAISMMNSALASLEQPNLNRSPNPPYYWLSKIEFVLNNFQFITNNNTYTNSPNSIWNTSPFNDPNAINLVWGTHPTNNGYGQGSFDNKQVVMTHSPAPLGQGLGNLGLVIHEIGHVLGLDHTWALHPSSTFTNIIVLPSNPNGTPPTPTLVDDFWFEDTLRWNKFSNGCGDSLKPFTSNNIMGYNFGCRSYFSPEQLGQMHYHLSNSRVCFVQNPSCTSNNSNTNITSNTIYTGALQQPLGNLVIKPGFKLTISGTVRMRENAKIIVEQGGKLIITSCGRLESFCGKLWEGIEVWGNSTKDQYVDQSTGMPTFQGMVDIDGGTIKDAKTGIYLAKKVNGNPDLTTTGGIVHSINANFINNQVGVDFYTYFTNSIILDEHGNRSYFKNNHFKFDQEYRGGASALPFAHIKGSEIANVKIYGCDFDGGNNDGANTILISNPLNTYGIYGIDSRFIVKDFCTNPINPTTCNGTPIRNSFTSCKTSVYLSNATTNYASSIDHATFSNDGFYQFSQIYINNVLGVQIINNDFNVAAINTVTTPNYGLYLNVCDGFMVENNYFTNQLGNPQLKAVGIYVNNSGTNPNSIYNNIFSTLKQPIWVTNVNYNSANGLGLVMNCNDFINSEYNIGVQRSGKLCGTCVNNVGVAKTQGMANTAQETDNVRNKYATPSCVTNAENKFYINTSNSFAITSHGSFNGNQWHPTPQTNASCSNSVELTDIVGTNPPNDPFNKSSYCPVGNISTFGSRTISGSKLAAHRANKKAFADSLAIMLDGGNTATLLSAINNATNNISLKNLLLSKAFLSDSVLITYFKKPNVPAANIKDIFDKNYPLSPVLWQKVINSTIAASTLNYMQNKQNESKLSKYNMLKAQLELVEREIGLLHHTTIQDWLTIENGPQYDSIFAILANGELPKAKFTKVGVLIGAKRHIAAQAAINSLRNESAENNNFCDLQQLALNISQNPTLLTTLKNNTGVKNQLLSMSNYADFLTEGLAIALLAKIYDIHIAEERMEPVLQASVSRYINTEEGNITSMILADNINVYPNPAKDQLFVESESDENAEIQLADLTGKVILKQNCTQSCIIQLNTLQNGIYLVNLYKQNILVSTKKIVVIK